MSRVAKYHIRLWNIICQDFAFCPVFFDYRHFHAELAEHPGEIYSDLAPTHDDNIPDLSGVCSNGIEELSEFRRRAKNTESVIFSERKTSARNDRFIPALDHRYQNFGTESGQVFKLKTYEGTPGGYSVFRYLQLAF